MPKADLNQLKTILDCLQAGVLIFENSENIYLNLAAKNFLKIQEPNLPLSESPYFNSLKDLLEINDIDFFSKQLTGQIGKPLEASLHDFKSNNWQIVELKESFETKLGEASHELRRPLANVKTLVDTLYLWGAAEEPVARGKFLGQLHSEVARLSKLIEELLDLSRLQAGAIPINLQQIALKIMVDESFELLTEQAKKKNIKLINQVSEDFVLIADLDKINHVLRNLIENAIRYNKENGEVIVLAQQLSNSFSVKDTGLGIEEKNIPLVFERFKRFNKDIAGTGLGLAIVKSIVDLHGGQIKIISEINKGTEFKVVLPKRKLVLPIYN